MTYQTGFDAMMQFGVALVPTLGVMLGVVYGVNFLARNLGKRFR